jgi:hypothetical protein
VVGRLPATATELAVFRNNRADVRFFRETLIPGVLLTAVLLLPGYAEARVTVESPSLVPRYSESTSDFTVRCATPVELRVTAGKGEKVSVDGRPPRTGAFTEAVTLSPGQGLKLRVAGKGKNRFQSVRCLPEDFPLWATSKSGTPQAEWYVTVPNFRLARGQRLPVFGEPYVAVVNRDGVPVWWFREPDGQPVDAKLAPGKLMAWTIFRDGEPYRFRRLDGSEVRRARSLSATTNFHDLQPTSDGGYLAIGEKRRDCPAVPADCVDLSRWGGPSAAVVIDNVIEKVNRRGRLVWSWSTKDNISPAEVGRWVSHPSIGLREYADGRWANDLFHVNSVEKDGDGAIISVRHADAVYRIGSGGRGISWKLGGTKTPKSLEIRSSAKGGTAFSGQHDARRLPDGTVSLLDNGSFEWRGPRALRFRLKRGTATLVEEVKDSRAAFSVCCGSARRMAGGNWVASWGGGSSIVSEVTAAGRPVLSLVFPGGLFSYRVDPVRPGRLKARDLRAGMDAQSPR